MQDSTRAEGLGILAGQNAVNALIETQVILQLLVRKGIVTVEEVNDMRKVVRNRPNYKKMLDDLNKASDKITDDIKFEETFEKMLYGGGGDVLTEEERNYMMNKLDIFDITV